MQLSGRLNIIPEVDDEHDEGEVDESDSEVEEIEDPRLSNTEVSNKRRRTDRFEADNTEVPEGQARLPTMLGDRQSLVSPLGSAFTTQELWNSLPASEAVIRNPPQFAPPRAPRPPSRQWPPRQTFEDTPQFFGEQPRNNTLIDSLRPMQQQNVQPSTSFDFLYPQQRIGSADQPP